MKKQIEQPTPTVELENYEDHDLAKLFPTMADDELNDLSDDIKKNGLREAITLFEGRVLDGRHRLQACRIAGVRPSFIQFEGEDAMAFVLSKNLTRRHLNASQRAMIAAKMATLPAGGVRQTANLQFAPTRAQAAAALGVSERSTNTASKVLRHAGKNTVQAVEQGKITVSAAAANLPQASKETVSQPEPDSAKASKPPVQDHEYNECLTRLRSLVGNKIVAAIKEGTFANLDRKGVIEWSKQSDEDIVKLNHYITEKRWKVKESISFIQVMPTSDHKIQRLVWLAHGDVLGEWEGTIDGVEFKLRVKRRKQAVLKIGNILEPATVC